MMKQAEGQVRAAGGTPVEWRFATPQAAEYFAQEFDREQVPIIVKFVPPKP